MAEQKVPYVMAYGNLKKALDRIQEAATPPRFTQDFLGTKLNLTGGSAKALIPYMKRTGFLASDGSPTDLYKRFRNPSERGAAAAEAVRTGYRALYEINEYIHDATDQKLKGAVVQATGLEPSSSTVGAMIGSFKALKSFADFEAKPAEPDAGAVAQDEAERRDTAGEGLPGGLNLGYTINLNLPATSDIAVFDAIFKSLREHLLR
jgi:Family of unknown function (DUF5343)